jgi:methylthioribose-1-phosphate isomerase
VDETRPLLQGLRLTAWELRRAGIAHRVLVEGAAAGLMRRGEVDAVLVGADRVCRNGDVANKIGTYGVALIARAHDVPFLVAAPLSTLDPTCARGEDVAIEERPADGLRYLRDGAFDPAEGLAAWGPAFDVTPAALVTALVSDRGVLERPDEARLRSWMDEASRLQRGGGDGR